MKVITGRDKGKQGRVLRVFPDEAKVLVEHVMMVKKHVRPNPQRNIKGGIAEQESRHCDFERAAGLPDLRPGRALDTRCAATARCASAKSAARHWTSSLDGSCSSLATAHEPERCSKLATRSSRLNPKP